MATERLQKILARGGLASRRAAEQWITEGRVRVNGRVVTELGAKADPRNDKVEVDGNRVIAEQLVYVVFHKPRGVVTTMSDPEGRASVKDLLAPIGARVFPVGRLDFATSGVMLATNDGDFSEGLMHPRKGVPKTYIVKVAGVMEPKDLDRWRNGIRLEDGMTKPATAKTIRLEPDKTWFELTIREGRNQQIRRMGEASGFPVMRLARLSFAGITSEGLRPGEWRPLTRDELMTLKKEYGVPKRIVTADEEELRGGSGRGRVQRGHAKRAPAPRAGAERSERGPRAAGARGERSAEERGERAPAGRGERGPGRGERGPGRGERGPAARDDRGGPRRGTRGGARVQGKPTEEKGRNVGRARGGASEEKGPRYGGGSPGRRPYDVREDWGGGAGRGRTGDDRARSDEGGSPRRGSSQGDRGRSSEERPRGDVGGRGGQSRTTGTGGGIGAREQGDYRVRRGPRR